MCACAGDSLMTVVREEALGTETRLCAGFALMGLAGAVPAIDAAVAAGCSTEEVQGAASDPLHKSSFERGLDALLVSLDRYGWSCGSG